MGSDVGQFFLTASLHREYSILYALVFEKEFSSWEKVGEKIFYPRVKSQIPLSGVQELIVSTFPSHIKPCHLAAIFIFFY